MFLSEELLLISIFEKLIFVALGLLLLKQKPTIEKKKKID